MNRNLAALGPRYRMSEDTPEMKEIMIIAKKELEFMDREREREVSGIAMQVLPEEGNDTDLRKHLLVFVMLAVWMEYIQRTLSQMQAETHLLQCLQTNYPTGNLNFLLSSNTLKQCALTAKGSTSPAKIFVGLSVCTVSTQSVFFTSRIIQTLKAAIA